jgi:hypothetical protein
MMPMRHKPWTDLLLLPIMGVFLWLALPGIHYGLPDQSHFYSYDCDEIMWLIGVQTATQTGHGISNPHMLQPSGYLWMYLTSLKVAEGVGFFKVDPVPPGQLRSRILFSRLFLAGRYLQILLALVLLNIAWEFCRRLYGVPVALLTTGLLALCPGLVATSHFSYSNIPIATLSLLAFAIMLWDLEQPHEGRKWLRLSALLAGMACGTKYSAFPLALPLFYCSWAKSKKITTCVESLALMGLGFSLVCPFAWLHPREFLTNYITLSHWLSRPIDGFFNRLTFPFLYPFPYCLGPVLWWTGVLAVGWALFQREKGTHAMLLWLGGLFYGAYRCGSIASPGRVLIAAPILILLIARMIYALYLRYPRGRVILSLATMGLFFSTLIITLTVSAIHQEMPPQKQASQWIAANIAPGTPIGLLDEAYYWTPDIIYPEARDIPSFKPLYPTQVVLTQEAARKLDYIVVAREIQVDTCAPMIRWLDANQDFKLVKYFKRQFHYKGFTWNRVERPYGSAEDDVWVSSLAIYQKIHKDAESTGAAHPS